MLACLDTAENVPCKVCPLSAYRSPRFERIRGLLSSAPPGSLSDAEKDRLQRKQTKLAHGEEYYRLKEAYLQTKMKETMMKK